MVTDSRKVILPVFGITGFALILVLIVVLVGISRLHQWPPFPADGSDVVWRTKALELFQPLNTQSDPCVNFHEFTCGQFQKINQLPPEASFYGSKEKRDLSVDQLFHSALVNDRANDPNPIKFIKRAYRACIADEFDQNLDVMLARICSKSPRATFIDFLGSGEDIFISLDVQPHPFNVSQNALWIKAAPTTIDSRVLAAFTNDSDPLFSLLPMYRDFVEDMMLKFYSPDEVGVAAKSLIDLQVHLASSRAYHGHCNWTSNLFIGTVNDLSAVTSKSFDWLSLLSLVTLVSGSRVSITHETPVIIRDINYLRAVTSVMQNVRMATHEEAARGRAFTSATLNDFFKLHLLTEYHFLADKGTILHEMRSLSPLRGEDAVRDYGARCRCLKLLRSHAPELVGRVFIDSVPVRKSNHDGIAKMVDVTLAQFAKLINKSTRLQEKAKSVLISRLSDIKINWSHPRWIMNDSALNKRFVFEYPVDSDPRMNSSFLMMQSVKHSRSRRVLDRLRQGVRQADILPSYSEKAGVFYDARFNRLVLPASIMTGHHYNSCLPSLVNYATVGAMIAHQVAHAIDLDSLKFTRNGTLIPESTLDKESLFNLTDSLNCFESQMTSIFYPRVNLHLNGKQTKMEDATDQLAIQIAIKSYLSLNDTSALGYELSRFNNKQQFYLAHGNTWCQLFYSNETIKVSISSASHSPRYFRSYLPFLHFNDFNDSFNCTASTFMMQQQCQVV